MSASNNCHYNNNNSFVNSFDLADYIIINYPRPLYLTQLLALMYFYQIGALIFNKILPFEDAIKVKDNYIYIEDINRKYRKYKKNDLRKLNIKKLPIIFTCKNKKEAFLNNLIKYCSKKTEEEVISIVIESYLFKATSIKVRKTINFKCPFTQHLSIRNFKAQNAFLPVFL